jgi:hypothetical protein
MSGFSAINDVGESLAKLIADTLSLTVSGKYVYDYRLDKSQITRSSPDEVTGQEKLSVFLYQITENSNLINDQLPEGIPGIGSPPVYLSLAYVITPYTENAANDALLLGEILQIFHDHPVLRGPVLHGSLADQELPLIFTPLSLDEMSKLWNTVSRCRPFRPSLCYQVTPVRINSGMGRDLRQPAGHGLTHP